MAEHRPILKNDQNMYQPRFGYTPKTGIAFPKTGFCFHCVLEKPLSSITLQNSAAVPEMDSNQSHY